ncbi:MAG: signal peptidase II [Thermodesulfobacteria bacterium]|nr:signal peptidase II [Thermodesulfobacteriota bacterium]
MAGSQRVFLLTCLLVLGLDQATKFLVREILAPGEIRVVIPGFFNLVHVWNPGVAFGFFARGAEGLRYFFILANLLAAGGLFLYARGKDHLVQFLSGLIAGGALGNLLDRIFYGRVFDFLDFHLGPYHWPAFNLADTAITLGVLGFFLKLLRES